MGQISSMGGSGEINWTRESINILRLLRFDWEDSFVKRTWGSLRTAVWASSALAIFGFGILFISIMAAVNPTLVFPHEEVIAASETAKVEYYLPYPGMLPDNPLYKLKAGRDRISLVLIRDERKKAEKELLLADKRINAAMFLTEGGKKDLGITTATKAEKYLESSVNRALKLTEEGKDVKSLLLTLEKAAAKHHELIDSLIDRGEGEDIRALESVRSISTESREKIAAVLESSD